MSKEPLTQIPWLVCSHGKGQKYHTFITAAAAANSENKHKYLRSIPQLCDKTILTCYRGWLLLRSDKNIQILSLWSTVSFETINLPPLEGKGEYRYVLSSTTSNPESVVVLLCDIVNPKIIFCKVTDKQWTIQNIYQELKYIKDGVEDVVTLDNPICMNDGIVYASSNTLPNTLFPMDETLFLIKVVESNLGIKVLVRSLHVRIPDCPCPHNIKGCEKRFVESCDELLMVIKSHRDMNFRDISHLQIFKMDFSRMSWQKMDNFKDRAIFLGDHYCLSCSTVDSKIKGNCIYFTENNSFYSFNKDGESLSLLMSPSNIRKFYSSDWMMLDLIRLSNEHVRKDDGIEKKSLEKSDKIEIKDGEEKKIAQEKANLCDLPSNIIEFIGKRLTLVDYMHFRITCREFQMAAPAFQWRTNSPELLYPLFMLFKNDMKTCDLIDPKYSERYFINFPEPLLDARTHFSKNGWLLMSTALDSFYFFNPSTKMIRTLPKMNLTFGPTHVAFSSSPTSPDCIIVGIRSDMEVWTKVYVIRSWNGEWQGWEHGTFENDNKIVDICNNTPVFCDDRFWFLGNEGELGVVKVNDDGFDWEALTKPESPCTCFEFNYLVECSGELFSIFVGYSGKWVQVFKLDSSKMIWLEIKSLKNHMFFVSYSSCFSMEAKIARMENKIYFPRLCDQSVIFYSLETEKFQSFASEDSPVDFQFSSVPLQCGWIEPKWD